MIRYDSRYVLLCMYACAVVGSQCEERGGGGCACAFSQDAKQFCWDVGLFCITLRLVL